MRTRRDAKVCLASSDNHVKITTSLQVKAQDHLAAYEVWSHMEQLLSGQREHLDAFIRHLTEVLPPLASIPAWDLPGIARIHMQSVSHIKIMMRSLAAEPMVLALIDLQIFHLLRVREVVAHMRVNAQARRVCRDMCAAAAGDGQQQRRSSSNSSSSSSSSTTADGSAEETLE